MKLQSYPDSKIRVALVTETTVGGVRQHILNIVGTIDRERFETTVILPQEGRKGHSVESDISGKLQEFGVPFIQVPMGREMSPLTDCLSFLALRNVFRDGRFDVIHAHGAKAGFLTRLYCKGERQRCFFSPHGFSFRKVTGWKKWVSLTLERRAASWSSDLILCSEVERKDAERYGLTGRGKAHVVPNAIQWPVAVASDARAAIRKETGTAGSATVFLTAGRLVSYKGHDLAIAAFAQAIRQQDSAELWIAGQGEQLKELQDLARRLNVFSRVRFLGYRKDIYPVLEGCDCFVLSSETEASPYSILEALAMQRPVIATGSDGARALLEGLSGCVVVPVGDEKTLAGAIRSYLDSPFSAPSIESLPSRWFDIRKQVAELEQIYGQIRTGHRDTETRR